MEKQTFYEKLAEQYGLLITGGSDWHGKGRRRCLRKPAQSLKLPERCLADLKAAVSYGNPLGKRIASNT
jgi:hypothetical protein